MPEIIQAWDLQLLTGMRSCHDPIIVWAAWTFSTIAWKGWLWCLIIAASWIRGRRTFACEVGLALAIATVAGLPLKSVIARARPDLYASQQLSIPMPELLTTAHSFPSGHVLLASAFAFVVLFRHKDLRAVLCFVFVALVSLARIYQGAHWPSDCIGSVALGYVAAALGCYAAKLPIIARFVKDKPSRRKADGPAEKTTAEPKERQPVAPR